MLDRPGHFLIGFPSPALSGSEWRSEGEVREEWAGNGTMNIQRNLRPLDIQGIAGVTTSNPCEPSETLGLLKAEHSRDLSPPVGSNLQVVLSQETQNYAAFWPLFSVSNRPASRGPLQAGVSSSYLSPGKPSTVCCRMTEIIANKATMWNRPVLRIQES